MFHKIKKIKRVTNSKQCDQWKIRTIDRRYYIIIQQTKMLILKKIDLSKREIKAKTNINYKTIIKIYKRVINK